MAPCALYETCSPALSARTGVPASGEVNGHPPLDERDDGVVGALVHIESGTDRERLAAAGAHDEGARGVFRNGEIGLPAQHFDPSVAAREPHADAR